MEKLRSSLYQRNGIWQTSFNGVRKSLRTKDRDKAMKLYLEMKEQKERESVGLTIPAKVKSALQLPLSKHLAHYLSEKEKDCTSFDSVRNIESRLNILFRECAWTRIADIDSFTFTQWRASSDRAVKTLNEYLTDISGFVKWLNRHGFWDQDPIKDIERLRTAGRERRKRRSLSVEEFNGLVTNTSEVGRRIAYMTAFYTGLRKNEIAQLQWGDIKLDTEQPHIAVRAKTTKNRKDANIPLLPPIAKVLRDFYEGQDQGDAVFKKPCHKTLNRDFEKAGIPKVDQSGRTVDFHSFRHSFGTMLACSGVSPREAQALMRHSDPSLTANVYVDAGKLLLSDAITKLPIAESVYQIVSEHGCTGVKESQSDSNTYKEGINGMTANKGNKGIESAKGCGQKNGAPVRSRT